MAGYFQVAPDDDDSDKVEISWGDDCDLNCVECDALNLVDLEDTVKKGLRILEYGTLDGSVPKHSLSPKQTANFMLVHFPKAWEAVVKILEGTRAYDNAWSEKPDEAIEAFPDQDENFQIDNFIRDSNVSTFGNDRNLIQKALDSHKSEIKDALFNSLKARFKQDGVSIDD